jgi:superfamily I DNA/RNA helicase
MEMTEYIDTLLPKETPEGQRSAVLRDDDLITVEAGAGTGKTWTLSSRFARLLLDPSSALQPCMPQNILTLTYTEAASREMQERIRKKTIETINDSRETSAINKKAIKNGFDDAWISTIHSFSSRVIRESGLSLDIDPHASVLSSPQEDAFWGGITRALDLTSLSRFANPYSHDLRIAAASLEKDEYLIAALEKWSPDKLCGLARGIVELHASLGHDADILLKWAAQAESQSDPQSKAVGLEIASLLSPEWRMVWALWHEILHSMESELRAERKKTRGSAGALALAGVMEKWADKTDKTDSDENQRLFFIDIYDNLTGTLPKIFKEKI